MKKAVKILSVALVAAMAVTFSACSSNSSTPTPAPTAPPTPTPAAAVATPTPASALATPTPAAALATSASAAAAPLQTGGDTTSPYTVSIYDDGDNQPSGVQAVDDAMTAYLGTQYGLTNTSVNLQFIIWNTYEQTLNPMLASGTPFDITYTSNGWGYNWVSNMPTGAYLDWQPYLSYVPAYQQMIQPYVQQLVAYCNSWAPRDTNGNLVQGLYMLPAFKEWAGQNCVIVNTSQAQQYNIDYSNIQTINDLTPLMAQYYAAAPNNIACVSTTGGPFGCASGMNEMLPHWNGFDNYFDNSQNKYVSNWTDSAWQNAKTLCQQWYAAGYIPDTEATDSTVGTLNNWLFTFNATAPVEIANAQDAQNAAQRGFDQVRIGLTSPVLATSNMYGNAFALSKTSGNPDRAAMVYMLICTDATLTNLWAFGVEGTDYTLDSNGQVVTDPSMIYDVSDRDYNTGNEFLRLSVVGEPQNIGQILTDFNNSAYDPKNDGFAFLMNQADQNNSQAAYGYDYPTLTTLQTNINNANSLPLAMGTLSDDQITALETQLTNAGWDGYIQNINDWYTQWQTDPVKYLSDHS